jgi:hypothetical protein
MLTRGAVVLLALAVLQVKRFLMEHRVDDALDLHAEIAASAGVGAEPSHAMQLPMQVLPQAAPPMAWNAQPALTTVAQPTFRHMPDSDRELSPPWALTTPSALLMPSSHNHHHHHRHGSRPLQRNSVAARLAAQNIRFAGGQVPSRGKSWVFV